MVVCCVGKEAGVTSQCVIDRKNNYVTFTHQGRRQDFLKGGSSTSMELPEVGVWGCSPQPLRDFQYFNESKLSKLLYFMQKVH